MNDEALYAGITNTISATGDWTSLKLYGAPYTHKPPLYFWLSAATSSWINEEEARYRLWAAIFGFGSIALTFVLGSMVFTPEIGLVAALILCNNRCFLLNHCVREGTMDSGVVFFTLLGLIIYWKLPRERNSWSGWIAIGTIAGIMCLLKPLIGLVLLIPIVLHWEIYEADSAWNFRLSYPSLALFISLLISCPWYLLQLARLGDTYIESAFRTNIMQRITVGIDPQHLHGPLYYWINASKSSIVFSLFIPAISVSTFLSLNSKNKRAFGLLSIFVLVWIIMFSFSSSKLPWYIFPVYPLISLSIVAVMTLLLSRLSEIYPAFFDKLKLPLIMAIICSIAVGDIFHLVAKEIPRHIKSHQYIPWVLYQSANVDSTDEVLFVVLDLPVQHFNHFETYYNAKLVKAIHVDNLEQMSDLMDVGKPIIVVVNKRAPSYLLKQVEDKFRPYSNLSFRGYWGYAYTKDLQDKIPKWLRKRGTRISSLSYSYPSERVAESILHHRNVPGSQSDVEVTRWDVWGFALQVHS